MAKVRVRCPKCGTGYKIDDIHLGKKSRCKKPDCQATFVMQPSDTASRSSSVGSSLSPSEPAARPLASASSSTTGERERGADGIPVDWQPKDVILDQYEVLEELGQGGMGKVHLVRHRGWQTDLAVKSILPGKLTSPTAVANFQLEAEVWVEKLGLHPNVVSCYYVRILGGVPRVFVEYIEGGSLVSWIEDSKLYAGGPGETLNRLLDVAIQFARGLQYTHEQGLVHQDVKPRNVMMTKTGVPKVTDFGLARAQVALGHTAEGMTTRPEVTSLAGTPSYQSPEQADGKRLTLATDIWSWAVSVLDMFIGAVERGRGRASDTALAMYADGKFRKAHIPAMPPGLIELLRRCLQPEPADRPSAMAEVAAALQAIYQQETGQPYPRAMPRVAKAVADTLNNRAVSMLDLGKPEAARKLWDEALKADLHHPDATYNSGLVRWRNAELNDDVLLANMRAVVQARPGEWLPVWLLANVHLERGDCEGALQVLGQVSDADAKRQKVRALRNLAEKLQPCSRRRLRSFEGSTQCTSLCLSEDGSFALSHSADLVRALTHKHTLKLWEASTGRCLHPFQGDTGAVRSVCLSKDGRFAVTACYDFKLHWWEASTGRCLSSFEGTEGLVEGWINSVCLSGDGRFALSGSTAGKLKLWEMSTGHCIRSFEGHTGEVSSVCLSGDSRLALSGSADRSLRLWEVSTGRCLRSFEGHTGGVSSACLSGDGRLALSGSADVTLRLWEASTGCCLRSFDGHSYGVYFVCLSRDGCLALSGIGDRTLKLWETTTGRCLRTFEGHALPITAACLSGDGRYILSGSQDSTLTLWETTPEWRTTASLQLSTPVTAETAVSSHDAFEKELTQGLAALALGSWNVAAACFDRARQQDGYLFNNKIMQPWAELYVRLPRKQFRMGQLANTFTKMGSVCRLSGDGRIALSGKVDGKLKLWETSTVRCLRWFEAYEGAETLMCLSEDGRFALIRSTDKTVKLSETSTGRCLTSFEALEGAHFPMCLSGDNRFALSGSVGGMLKLWETSTGRCLRSLKGAGDVKTVCLNGDGRFALSGRLDGTLQMWETSTGRCLRRFSGHNFMVWSVCLSGDGRFALSGGRLSLSQGSYNNLILWEVSTGRRLRSFEEHTGDVYAVCLSGDNRFAVSGSEDGTMKLWDASTGRCLRSFEGHTKPLTSVCLSRDGRFALSGSQDSTLKLWSLDWDLEIREPADWDEGARPCLESFLARQTPFVGSLPKDRTPTEAEVIRALTRQGKPSWTAADFQQFLYTLGCAGYGWLRPEGVRRELEKMAANWQGPPPLT